MYARGPARNGDSAGGASGPSTGEAALGEAGSATEPDWARFLDLAFLAGEMSLCFRDLHQESLAERFALESIKASNGRGRRRVLSQATRRSPPREPSPAGCRTCRRSVRPKTRGAFKPSA